MLERFFGLDDPWERPRPALSRRDWLVALAFFAFTAVSLELIRSYADWTDAQPAPVAYAALVSGTLPLVWRRRHPLPVAVYSAVHFVLVGTFVPEIAYQQGMQLTYFFAVFVAVAWARNRRLMLALMLAIAVLWFAWMAWDFAYGQAVSTLMADLADMEQQGLLPPIPAAVLYSSLVTSLFLFGAIGLGQANWNQARDRARLAAQANTIAAQSASLRDQAVVAERLRIARELHDVVAHHVSVIGIQAGAARRVLTRDPDAAATALRGVEESSRDAVTEMRNLLGTLRGAGPEGAEPATGRAPEPTASDIEALVAGFATDGFTPTFAAVEDAPGALDALPLPVGLSLSRTVQEALTNVRKHSTARTASVTVRVGRDGAHRCAEAEVLDDGRPRAGTSGSGLGHLGMRERINSHGGTAEIGPRLTGGYRVRVRFPLKEAA